LNFDFFFTRKRLTIGESKRRLTGRPTNFKLGTLMAYDDPHHRYARWPPSWKLWVVVQVTTCRGRGHIVAAALQATQLVNVFCFILYTLSQTRVQSSSLSVFLRN